MKSITLLLPFVLMSLLMSVAASAQNYAVGHRTFSFTDAARSNRAVAGHVYYPATTAGDNKTFATGTFPVVVFGHGFTITYTEYDFFWTSLVQNGYIVVMPTTEGGLSPNHGNFGGDLSYLVTKMNSENATLSSPYYRHLTGKSAVMGHSMGGGAAFLAAASNNAAINTMVTFAAAETTPSAKTAALSVKIPTLVMAGSLDCVAKPVDHQKPMFNNLTVVPYRAYIEVKTGSHCQFGKASGGSRCTLAEGISCGGSAGSFVAKASQQQQMNNATLPWLNYFLKNNCTGWTQFRSYLTTSSLHTYMQAGASGASCLMGSGTARLAAHATPNGNVLSFEMDEMDTDFFVVERSAEGVNFEAIGQVALANKTNYTFSDNNPLAEGTYRVTAVSNKGEKMYSPVAEVQRAAASRLAFSVFPNPTTAIATLSFVADTETETPVLVLDATGKVAQQTTITTNKGENTALLNLSNLASGVYYIRLNIGTQMRTEKLVKQ